MLGCKEEEVGHHEWVVLVVREPVLIAFLRPAARALLGGVRIEALEESTIKERCGRLDRIKR